MARWLAVIFTTATLAAQVPDRNFWLVNGACSSTQIDVLDPDFNVLTTIPIPFRPSIAKAVDGTVWLVAGGSLTPFTGIAAGPTVATGVQWVAADASGLIWTLNGPDVTLRDCQGTPLASFAHGLSVPQCILSEPQGGVWVIDGHVLVNGQLLPRPIAHVSQAGIVTSQLAAPAAVVLDSAVDRQGHLWLVNNDNSLEVFTPAGAAPTQVSVPGDHESICVDPIGRVRLLSRVNGDNRMRILDSNGAIVSEQDLPQSSVIFGAWTRLRVDLFGRTWLHVCGADLLCLDPDGNTESVLPAAGGSRWFVGDEASTHLVGVLVPNADSDSDGFSNELEARAGSDALRAASTPPQLQVTNLVAGQTGALAVLAPEAANEAFILVASFGLGQVQVSTFSPITLRLVPDPLFTFWLSPANVLVQPSVVGILDATGTRTVNINVPPGAAGISIFLSAAIVDVQVPRITSMALPLQVTF